MVMEPIVHVLLKDIDYMCTSTTNFILRKGAEQDRSVQPGINIEILLDET